MTGKKRDRTPAGPAMDHGEALIRQAFDAAGAVLLVRDAEGRIEAVNQAFLDLFGGARDSWIGETFDLGLEPGRGKGEARLDTPSGPVWIDWEVRRLGPVEAGDAEHGDAEDCGPEDGGPEDGGPEDCDAESGETEPGQRDPAGSVALGRDITSQRAHFADMEAAQRAKSVFFAAVTHELRTPLAGALGVAGLLADTRLQPDQASYVEALAASTRHALAMIDDILDLSRLEAGRLELRPCDTDLAALVRETVELAAPRAAEKGLEIAVLIRRGAPIAVRADPARLKQILFNLIGNAVKFTDQGGVRVDVSGASQDGVRISVRDTGPGIAPADQPALFEQFERGAADRDGRESGAGLGLAMARRLVDAMGGEIGLESRLGEGAEFWFELPLPVQARALEEPLRGERFAVAAPDALLRSALADQIRALGGEALEIDDPACLRAASGRELLLDSAWADQAGASGAARAWILVGAAEKNPVIRALPDGVEGWLVKPVRRESLIERISQPLASDEPVRPERSKAEFDIAPADQGRLAGLRILLAEDDPVNALIARKLLSDMGAEVEWVASGGAAFRALMEARQNGSLPDAALVDQRMPEMDGPDLARKARAAGFGLPLIALTANDTETDRKLCHAAGMNAFLAKPVDREQLAMTLEELCGRENRASLA